MRLPGLTDLATSSRQELGRDHGDFDLAAGEAFAGLA